MRQPEPGELVCVRDEFGADFVIDDVGEDQPYGEDGVFVVHDRSGRMYYVEDENGDWVTCLEP